jgi:hypothetical protein
MKMTAATGIKISASLDSDMGSTTDPISRALSAF